MSMNTHIYIHYNISIYIKVLAVYMHFVFIFVWLKSTTTPSESVCTPITECNSPSVESVSSQTSQISQTSNSVSPVSQMFYSKALLSKRLVDITISTDEDVSNTNEQQQNSNQYNQRHNNKYHTNYSRQYENQRKWQKSTRNISPKFAMISPLYFRSPPSAANSQRMSKKSYFKKLSNFNKNVQIIHHSQSYNNQIKFNKNKENEPANKKSKHHKKCSSLSSCTISGIECFDDYESIHSNISQKSIRINENHKNTMSELLLSYEQFEKHNVLKKHKKHRLSKQKQRLKYKHTHSISYHKKRKEKISSQLSQLCIELPFDTDRIYNRWRKKREQLKNATTAAKKKTKSRKLHFNTLSSPSHRHSKHRRRKYNESKDEMHMSLFKAKHSRQSTKRRQNCKQEYNLLRLPMVVYLY